MISIIPYIKILLILVSFASCQTSEIKEISSLPLELAENSAAVVINDTVLWTLEDHGNDPKLYAVDIHTGKLLRTVEIDGIKNIDWEALTTDGNGNLYIGDIGNNKGKRKEYYIHKVMLSDMPLWKPETITFTLPKKIKNSDFESLLYWNNHFYAFTKEKGKAALIKINNKKGKQEANIVTYFNLKGDSNKITAAAMSPDRKTVVLLNHDKLWKLTNFEGDNFFSGTIDKVYFNHDTQKEGICFINKNNLLITDERNNFEGGKCYLFTLPSN